MAVAPAAVRPSAPAALPWMAVGSRPRPWRFVVLLAGCLLLAVALRLPFLHVPLGIDEGGGAYIARQWWSGHGNLYGGLWFDRPPGLLLLLKVGLLDGTVGIRILGAAAAVVVVLAVAWSARVVAGDRAGALAALLAAALTGSSAISGVFTTGELLATAPAALSIGALVTAHRRGGAWWVAAAGALAVCALLVKQSFADAGAAGVVFLMASAALDRRRVWRWVAAYAAGASVPLLAVAAWLALTGTAPGRLAFALFGFRIVALRTLAASSVPLPDRVRALIDPTLRSGLVVAIPIALAGLVRLGRRDRVLAITFAVWLVVGLVGVLGGGSYWPHYLLQLVPAVSILAAVALAGAGRLVRVPVVAGIAGLAVAVSATGGAAAIRRPPHATELAVARYVHRHARPGDTLYVLYARANLLYDAGLPTPYPYAWSLMMRATPGAPARLRRLLASPARPTWVVAWQHVRSWGLDPHHATRRLLTTWYRPVARVDGHVILHARRRPSAGRGRGRSGSGAPARGARGHAERQRAPVRERRAR